MSVTFLWVYIGATGNYAYLCFLLKTKSNKERLRNILGRRKYVSMQNVILYFATMQALKQDLP